MATIFSCNINTKKWNSKLFIPIQPFKNISSDNPFGNVYALYVYAWRDITFKFVI